ncbi:MAG: lysophospholipid acyltransferase family protein [Planctomycetia bacterium]
MKTDGWLYRFAVSLMAPILRVWMSTLRVKAHADDDRSDPFLHPEPNPFIYALWHESLLLAATYHRRFRPKVMISKSRDGEFITRVVKSLGLDVVRGSSTRGGAQAVMELVDLVRSGFRLKLAVLADGPRGPRRELKPGAVFIASATGLEIVPIAYAYDRPWRAKSWDRMAVPRPFSRAVVVMGTPIAVAEGLEREDLERCRLRVEAAMNDAYDRAERWLKGEHPSKTRTPIELPPARAA